MDPSSSPTNDANTHGSARTTARPLRPLTDGPPVPLLLLSEERRKGLVGGGSLERRRLASKWAVSGALWRSKWQNPPGLKTISRWACHMKERREGEGLSIKG